MKHVIKALRDSYSGSSSFDEQLTYQISRLEAMQVSHAYDADVFYTILVHINELISQHKESSKDVFTAEEGLKRLEERLREGVR